MVLDDVVRGRLGVEPAQIAELCRRWQITELSLYGSAVRDDFRDDSDVDVLVVFDPEARWDLWDFGRLEGELAELFGRKVDLTEKAALRNPFRRHSALTSRRVLYAG